MIEHLYQIIYCSGREGRAYRREIAVSHSGDMMVTNVETLPPYYDQALERFRDDQEAVVGIAGGLSFLKPLTQCTKLLTSLTLLDMSTILSSA